jgi:hypothetical protein
MRALGVAFLVAGMVGAMVFGVMLSRARPAGAVKAVLSGESYAQDFDEMSVLSGERTQGAILQERVDLFFGLLVVSGLFAVGGLLPTLLSKPGAKPAPPGLAK